MTDEGGGGYAASWKKSKYEYVKGVMALRPPTLQWHPLKESHAEALRMAIDCITGARRRAHHFRRLPAPLHRQRLRWDACADRI
jgi:hypothetical protein